jgi:ABC-type uncharacterized transport system substrate-binding protein
MFIGVFCGMLRRYTMTQKIAWVIVLLLLVNGGFAHAQQQRKIPRIGILLPNPPAVTPQLLKTFQQGLRELGYDEGENIVIEYRFGEGKSERYPYLAAELVQLKVDVIVTSSTPAIESVKNATSTIPIVMAASAEPVGSGLIASLDRPGWQHYWVDHAVSRVERKTSGTPQGNRSKALPRSRPMESDEYKQRGKLERKPTRSARVEDASPIH